MLVGWLAALAMVPIDEGRPPRPTDRQLVAELVAARPGAEILQQTSFTSADKGVHAVCGVARIEGRLEPFSVGAAWGPSWTHAADDTRSRNPVRGPDHWIVLVSAPATRGRDGEMLTGEARARWDALARHQALSVCPDPVTPEDAALSTSFH